MENKSIESILKDIDKWASEKKRIVAFLCYDDESGNLCGGMNGGVEETACLLSATAFEKPEFKEALCIATKLILDEEMKKDEGKPTNKVSPKNKSKYIN